MKMNLRILTALLVAFATSALFSQTLDLSWYGSGTVTGQINTVIPGTAYVYGYGYANGGDAPPDTWSLNIGDATNTYGGAPYCTHLQWNIGTTVSGYAGFAWHIENATISFGTYYDESAYISMWCKTATPSLGHGINVQLIGASNWAHGSPVTNTILQHQGGKAVDLATLHAFTTSWQEFQIPLRSLTNNRIPHDLSICEIKVQADVSAGTVGIPQSVFVGDINIYHVGGGGDVTAPTVTGMNWTHVGKTVTFNWTASDVDDSGLSNSLNISLNNDSTAEYAQKFPNYTGTGAQYTFAAYGTYQWQIHAVDPAGNKITTGWQTLTLTSNGGGGGTTNRDWTKNNNIPADNTSSITLTVLANSVADTQQALIGSIKIDSLDPTLGVMGTGDQAGLTPDLFFTISNQNIGLTAIIPGTTYLTKPANLKVLTPNPSALYTFDGVKWIKVGGIYKNSTSELTVPISAIGGTYAVFDADIPAASKLTSVGAAGQFTPNGDGIYDTLPFYFDNPKNEKVSITIFDLKGKTVKTFKTANTGDAWDGTDDSGNAAPRGPYIYQVKIGASTFTGTAILIK